jgi:hypothetical protein
VSDTKESPSQIIRDRVEEERPARSAYATTSFLLHALVAMVISPIVVVAMGLGAVLIFNNSHGNKFGL